MAKKIIEKKVVNDDEIMVNPYQYFQNVKGKIQEMNDNKLFDIYNNALNLATIYNKTGQKKGLRKLIFHIQSIMKEQQALDKGITKFVYKDDIEEYIENVADKQVVILDIANYERRIPDEIVEAISKVKDIFDEFYIVCTDYNGSLSKQVQKERREKDPILFGVFLDRDKQAINERFYYIGDWVDEYCDLTLDKMISEMDKAGKKIINPVMIPSSTEELEAQLDSLKLDEKLINENLSQITLVSSDIDLNRKEPYKKNIFSKVKSFIKKDK